MKIKEIVEELKAMPLWMALAFIVLGTASLSFAHGIINQIVSTGAPIPSSTSIQNQILSNADMGLYITAWVGAIATIFMGLLFNGISVSSIYLKIKATQLPPRNRIARLPLR
jgi:hypothetical protein